MRFVVALVLLMIGFAGTADAQKIFATRNGKVSFSAPSDDDVKAVNNEVVSRIADNGQVTFTMLIKSFRFKLAEMQDHFNDEYLESNQYPRAEFKGNITNLAAVNFSKDGVYKAAVTGDLTMHGVTKNMTANGTIEIKGGKPLVTAQFNVVLKDFNISAKAVTDKVTVELNCQYQ